MVFFLCLYHHHNQNCKKIYITDDNPRDESPIKIRKQLSKYIDKSKLYNIADRALAIKKAIQNSNPQEIILIAGKGHEEQQIYKNKIKYISDKKIVKNLKIKKKVLSKKKQNYLQNQLIFKQILKKNKSPNFQGLSIDTRTIKSQEKL